MGITDVIEDVSKRSQDLCCNHAGGLTSTDSNISGEVDNNKTTNNQNNNLSHVGNAAYDILKKKHSIYQNEQWNLTNGRVVGKLHQTPKDAFSGTDEPLRDGHDDWFPEIISTIMKRTQVWCDVCSLTLPDGLFLEKIKDALSVIAETSKTSKEPIIVRMMFGNIITQPINCNAISKELTSHLPKDCKLQLWVGAWRRGTSWNHAKIIAVDGQYLHTGGHNLWDPHYLKRNPIHDLSLELEGDIAHDAHLFANKQWSFIEDKQETFIGGLIDKLPDNFLHITRNRVTVTEWPTGIASIFPPSYTRSLESLPKYTMDKLYPKVNIISMGRYGKIMNNKQHRPSDDAFLAMFDSAQTIIRMAIQDLGPICIPGTKRAVPGLTWPHETLRVLGKAIWERGVDVEIVQSNPGSIPGGLTPTEASYSNGWTCTDVASEIIKAIREQYPCGVNDDDEQYRKKLEDNLRICYVRQSRGNTWPEEEDGDTPFMGLHSKHFIIDDVATYIGSQNLYECDLAEWGVVIDDIDTTKRFIDEYWTPMWRYSYKDGQDVQIQEVMDGLDVDRDGEGDIKDLDDETRKRIVEVENALNGNPNGKFYETEEA